MIKSPLELLLKSPENTAEFAGRIGSVLQPGDCILLEGPIGAGKTHFARSVILSLLDHPEDIPSPTFTLVQTYETDDAEIWHADLYRLSHPDEVHELGLIDAFDTAVCLVEWPEKMGPQAPPHALAVSFAPDPAGADTRRVILRWSDPKWTLKLDILAND